MNKDEALKMALEALKYAAEQVFCQNNDDTIALAITVIKEALAQAEQQWTPEDTAYRPGGLPQSAPTPEQLAALGWQSIECPFCGTSGAQAFPKPEQDWEAIAADQAMTIAMMKSEQEPVAWMHTQLSDVAITHEPSDLKRHPERWTALYPEPKPCPTCEALARTVMLDQTSHDRPKREWVGLTDAERAECWSSSAKQSAINIEAKLKEKNT